MADDLDVLLTSKETVSDIEALVAALGRLGVHLLFVRPYRTRRTRNPHIGRRTLRNCSSLYYPPQRALIVMSGGSGQMNVCNFRGQVGLDW